MADKTNESLVGKQLGDYKLVDALAVGGMSQVYIGEDVNLGRRAAVKVLTQEILAKDPNMTERFQREAKAVAAMEHENIITIYQYGEQDDVYFLAMRLIQGQDLADELNSLQRTGKLMEIERMLDLLQQVASALDHAHQGGIIHRDVKPSNILIDKNDRAVLTDFGLVLRQSIDTTMGTAFGTPRYISPEQALASEDALPQSDIYSLAVIVYEIITGQMIYKADTAMGFALSHISEPPPPPRIINPDVPRAVERELLKALEKKPEKRHKTATEFINALRDGYKNVLQEQAKEKKDTVQDEIPIDATPVFASPPDMKKMLAEKKAKAKVDDSPTVIGPDLPSKPSHETIVKEEKKKKRSSLPLLLSMLIITAIAVVGFVVLSSGDSNTTTTTPEAATASTVQTEAVDEDMGENTDVTTSQIDSEPLPAGGEPVVAMYEFDIFAIRNDSEQTLDITNLVLVRDDESDSFEGSDVPGGTLAPGDCMVIRVQVRNVDIPEAWNCGDDSTVTTLPTNRLFWRTDSTESFEVRRNTRRATICDTITRSDSGECEFSWLDVLE